MGEDLAVPRRQGVGEGADLFHVVSPAAGDGLVQQRDLEFCLLKHFGSVLVAGA